MESERSFEDTNPASHVCFNVSISSSRLVVSSKVAAYGKSSKPIKRFSPSCLFQCVNLSPVTFHTSLSVWKFQPNFMGILQVTCSRDLPQVEHNHHLASLKLGMCVFFQKTWIQLSFLKIHPVFLFALLNAMSYFRNSLRKASLWILWVDVPHQKFHLQTSQNEQQPVSAVGVFRLPVPEVSSLRCAACPPGTFRQANSPSCFSVPWHWRHKKGTWESWNFHIKQREPTPKVLCTWEFFQSMV